jgi:hypothetical protein
VSKVPLLQQRLGVEGQELQSKTIEVSLLQSELGDTLAATQMWRKKAQEDAEQLTVATGELDRWYHDPLITGLLGFTGGVLATSAVVLTFHH